MEGHTACVFGSSLVIFGGKNDIYSNHEAHYCNKVRLVNDVSLLFNRHYNLHQLQLMPATPSPRGRAYHTASIYREKHMVVVGGMMEKPDEQLNCMRSVDILDLELQRWFHAIAKGDQPISRIHHASAVVKGDLFIHGGYPLCVDTNGVSKEFPSHQLLSMGNLLFDTFALSLETMVWRRVKSTAIARPLLWGHSGVEFRDTILLFGGLDASKGQEVGDLVLWDMRKQAWHWAKCISPVASAMHKAVVVGMHGSNHGEPTHMLVFGGIQFSTQESISELREFDFQNAQWKILHDTGDVPAGRIGHVLLSYMSDKVLLLGGVVRSPNGPVQDLSLYIYHVPTREWKRILLSDGEKPPIKAETHMYPEPFIAYSPIDHEEKRNEPQFDRTQENKGLESVTEGTNTQLLGKQLAMFQKPKEMLYQSFAGEKAQGFNKGNLGGGGLESDSYDAPPPLPSAAYTPSRNHIQGPVDAVANQQKTDEKANKNIRKLQKNAGGSNFVGSVSNLSNEQIFDDLVHLMNVSLFEGEKNAPLEETENASVANTLSYVSPRVIKKLVDSALRREASGELPDHINNGPSLKDPFTYLRPTEAVLRWRQGSSAP
ncbi:putative Kelch repeat protein [Trypanosoma conorhini]|uniref:Putative Kelch repeat protein n=1 Tax=Trypanosoma conorhini TaxID=83891 RepID=A0A3R7RJM7_9TRYP|nr:putative Kelch repeat protein [Trypanosoma conorhini]RNF05506.1 putative Kelch repeat protein [Trypanosoma conorhini]